MALPTLTDPNLQRFTYNPSGSTLNKRPTVRFDVNVTDKAQGRAFVDLSDGQGRAGLPQ